MLSNLDPHQSQVKVRTRLNVCRLAEFSRRPPAPMMYLDLFDTGLFLTVMGVLKEITSGFLDVIVE